MEVTARHSERPERPSYVVSKPELFFVENAINDSNYRFCTNVHLIILLPYLLPFRAECHTQTRITFHIPKEAIMGSNIESKCTAQ